MCVNYKPTSAQVAGALTGASTEGIGDWPEETWQDYAAPLVRADAGGRPELLVGTYGMLPKRFQQGAPISTLNARAETLAEKRSYANAWRRIQTCLLPTEWFVEPNYESGKAQRWAIGMADQRPFCLAGLWRAWEEPEGGLSFSFTQITINADRHPLMRRFHKPGEEKRSVVIIPRSQYGAWLNAGSPELARAMLRLTPAASMKAWPAEKDYRETRQSDLF